MRKIKVKKIAKLVGYTTHEKRKYTKIEGYHFMPNSTPDNIIVSHPYEIILNKPDTGRARYQYLKRHS